jgi:N-acetylneuraminic acid mutarotase
MKFRRSAAVTAAGFLVVAGASLTPPAFAITTLLKVTKRIIPADDPGRFDLKIDSVTRASGVGQGGSTGFLQVGPGMHTVREAAANAASNLHNYTITYAGDCDSSGHVTLSVGQHKSCVISNTRKKWVTKASMPTVREQMAVGVISQKLYVVGGQHYSASGYLAKNEMYNPTTNSWTTKAPMPTPRTGLAAGVINGILYAVGGRSISAGGGEVYATTLEAYDPVTNSWTTKAPMPTGRAQISAGVINGILYVVGGNTSSFGPALHKVEAYNPVTNSWTTKAPMPVAQTRLAVAVFGNNLYTIGGLTHGNSGSELATVQAYNPATNSWASKPPLPATRSGLAAGVASGLIFAVGGPVSIGKSEAYDGLTNSWFTSVPMPTRRFFLGMGVINNTLYAVGGRAYSQSGNDLGTLEAYGP